MTIAEYFAKPDAERVLLVEIQRSDASTTCYRLSDAPYWTESTDSPASIAYSPVLQSLPEFRKQLAEPFDGEASTGFGTFQLSDSTVSYTDTGGHDVGEIELKRGAEVTVRLAAPRDLFPLSDAITLAVGTLRRSGGATDGGLSFEIVDASQEISDKPIDIDTAVGPQCWGYCRNITPFLVDPATLKYAVHTGAVEDIVAVYDDGVLLTLTTDYTKTNASGYFELVASPVGVVTADVKGAKVGGVWLDSTEEIIDQLLSDAGVSVTTTMTLPTGVVGYYITQSTTLGAVLTALVKGCAGYWLINRTGEFIAAQYPLPAAGDEYDEYTILGDSTWTESDRLYDAIRYGYRKNWTKYQAKPAATTAQATFAAGDGMEDRQTTTPADTELAHEESPLFQTWFDAQADAEDVADRLLTLYSVPRKFLPLSVPYSAAIELGDAITVTFDGSTYDGAIVGLSDVFDGAYPIQRITVVI